MNIEKVPSFGRFAPKPKSKASSELSDAQFNQTLKKALGAEEASPESSLQPDEIDPDKLRLIRSRINSGYYNRSEVIDSTAEKILNKGEQND